VHAWCTYLNVGGTCRASGWVGWHIRSITYHTGRSQQGSQAPLGGFDQLVEGPWPISTSCPPGGPLGRASAFWRENRLKHPPFRLQNLDQRVEDPSTVSRISGLRPLNFDPSTSLRALGASASKAVKPEGRLSGCQDLQQSSRPQDRVHKLQVCGIIVCMGWDGPTATGLASLCAWVGLASNAMVVRMGWVCIIWT
jgi:hypothetical protein